MAVFSHVLVPGKDRATKTTIGAAASSAELVFGKNARFVIIADAAMQIRFGRTGMAAATVADLLLPANVLLTFDCGDEFTAIRVFSTPGGNFYTLPITSR